MCEAPDIVDPAPAVAPPPVLEQVAPKTSKEELLKKKRSGFIDYQLEPIPKIKSPSIGSIPKKKGV